MVVNGCIVLLAFQTHCGEDCYRGNVHTQFWNVNNMVKSIIRNVFVKYKYPIVIFEEDYDTFQKNKIKNSYSNVVFKKVDFSPKSFPNYLNIDKVRLQVETSHRNKNISAPSMRGTFHGFGYRMMCRFYAYFILKRLEEYDWYMRVDAGDSRFTGKFKFDIFEFMEKNSYKYGYHAVSTAAPNKRLDKTLLQFKLFNNVSVDKKLEKPFFKNGIYNGKYYYNNFEILHIPSFLNPVYKKLFYMVDKSGAFMIGNTYKKNLGDADFRSVAIPFILKSNQVVKLNIPYKHPAPWNEIYL